MATNICAATGWKDERAVDAVNAIFEIACHNMKRAVRLAAEVHTFFQEVGREPRPTMKTRKNTPHGGPPMIKKKLLEAAAAGTPEGRHIEVKLSDGWAHDPECPCQDASHRFVTVV